MITDFTKGQDKVVFDGQYRELREVNGDTYLYYSPGPDSQYHTGLILQDVTGLRIAEQTLTLPGSDNARTYSVII